MNSRFFKKPVQSLWWSSFSLCYFILSFTMLLIRPKITERDEKIGSFLFLPAYTIGLDPPWVQRGNSLVVTVVQICLLILWVGRTSDTPNHPLVVGLFTLSLAGEHQCLLLVLITFSGLGAHATHWGPRELPRAVLVFKELRIDTSRSLYPWFLQHALLAA